MKHNKKKIKRERKYWLALVAILILVIAFQHLTPKPLTYQACEEVIKEVVIDNSEEVKRLQGFLDKKDEIIANKQTEIKELAELLEVSVDQTRRMIKTAEEMQEIFEEIFNY